LKAGVQLGLKETGVQRHVNHVAEHDIQGSDVLHDRENGTLKLFGISGVLVEVLAINNNNNNNEARLV
jgi:hypothetical protein